MGFEPTPFGPEPKSSALDHSAKLSFVELFGTEINKFEHRIAKHNYVPKVVKKKGMILCLEQNHMVLPD